MSGKRAGESEHVGQTLQLSAKNIVDTTAPYHLVSKMRASFWVIGPLLARMGEARVSMPGGCAIGTRPVDFHLDALRALGAEIDIEEGYVIARAPRRLAGARVKFPRVSVGATHTALMAASLARGETVIENAAREPEIVDVADCLGKMGAKIEGAGTSTIRVQGTDRLHAARHSVLPDRIETGTYAMAVVMAGGDVLLEGARPDLLQAAVDLLVKVGAEIVVTNDGIRVRRDGTGIAPVEVATAPFPGFPTDLQAQLMALMSRARGTSRITETIFENRFMHVQELARLGARIHLDGETATIEGVERLKGAPVMATDLRASVSLVIAGLAAEGETVVHRVYHLDRGFERLEHKLARCGAMIERVAG
jgi:UDP-N-acetylglucosamine 1-carboxyvinyltransferase